MRMRTDTISERVLLSMGYAVFATYLIGHAIMYAWNIGVNYFIAVPVITHETALLFQCAFNFCVAMKYYWN